METYTKSQIIEMIYRQQGDSEALMQKVAQRVALRITDEQFNDMVKDSGIPLKSLGYNRYYIA